MAKSESHSTFDGVEKVMFIERTPKELGRGGRETTKAAPLTLGVARKGEIGKGVTNTEKILKGFGVESQVERQRNRSIGGLGMYREFLKWRSGSGYEAPCSEEETSLPSIRV